MSDFNKIPADKPKADCQSEANRWLDKAVAMETEGKSTKMVDMAFDKALAYENAAFDGRA